MDKIKEQLQHLMDISSDKNRVKLYNNFYGTLSNLKEIEYFGVLNNMYRNFSGLMVHAELTKAEYDILKSLLEQIYSYCSVE
jgi:tRNA C32,U32 (ribose-2'-O)-methylase TrmJ